MADNNNKSVLSADEIDNIRQELKTYLEEHKNDPQVTNRTVAKSIGQSPGYISTFVNNKFPSPNTEANFAFKVLKFLNDEKQNFLKTDNEEIVHVNIQAYEEFSKIALHARDRRKIDLITGDPGVGKTGACKMFKKKYTRIYHFECTSLFSAKSLLHRLTKLLKITDDSGTLDDLFIRVADHLKDSGFLLIFDEMEYMPKQGLEIIRRIWDLSNGGVGMLFVGTEELAKNICGVRKRGNYAQLYRRISMMHHLTSKLNAEDAQEVVAANYPELLKKWRIAYSYCRENVGHLSTLIDNIKTLKQNDPTEITDKDISDAAELSILGSDLLNRR